MAAPTPVTRVTPSGRQIGTGAPAYITFTLDPNIDLWEKSVKPPSFQLDDRKDNSTAHNDRFRTFSPGRLLTGQDITVQCGYDPDQIQDIIDRIGVRDTITVTFPTGTKIAFYGWLDQVDFSELTEDDDPTVTLTLAQGNQDWSTCVEEGPVVVAGTGTTASC